VRAVNANSYSDSFSHSYRYCYGAAGNADANTYCDTDATT
jgi:hypothetical protein